MDGINEPLIYRLPIWNKHIQKVVGSNIFVRDQPCLYPGTVVLQQNHRKKLQKSIENGFAHQIYTVAFDNNNISGLNLILLHTIKKYSFVLLPLWAVDWSTDFAFFVP